MTHCYCNLVANYYTEASSAQKFSNRGAEAREMSVDVEVVAEPIVFKLENCIENL